MELKDYILIAATLFAIGLYLYHFFLANKYKKESQRLQRRFAGIISLEDEQKRMMLAFEEEMETLNRTRFAEIDALEIEKKENLRRLDSERMDLQSAINEMKDVRDKSREEAKQIIDGIKKMRQEFNELSEQSNLYEFGFYDPIYDFSSSKLYAEKLDLIRDQQKKMIKDKTAAICHTEWTVEGSKKRGQKMTNDAIKLILRAFNGECDAAVAKVKYNNVHVMEKRITKSYETINKLSSTNHIEILSHFFELKLEELHLAHEYRAKVQAEKEEQREIRAQMREEERAQREIEKAREQAEKEERQYQKALEKARSEVLDTHGAKQEKLKDKIAALEARLTEAQSNKERAISRAQMTRSGHVYVLSNFGSFGEQVFKIGMTRRLEPMDRVRELGDASVPFKFDVHAIIYCEDAPQLENQLHQHFAHRRINQINNRKEFFFTDIESIANAVNEYHGEIEVIKSVDSEEYSQSVARLKELAIEQNVELQREVEVPDVIKALLSHVN